MGSKSLN